MPVRFIQTSEVVPACVLPCPLPAINLTPKITIPFLGTELTSGANLTLKGGCSDCQISLDLYAKLHPYLLSLGLPLCAMGCALALLGAVQDVVGVVVSTIDVFASVPPDPTALDDLKKSGTKLVTTDVPDIINKCRCLTDLFLPTGVCAFIKLLRDTLRLVAAILKCLATLLGDILRIGLKAQILSHSPDIRVQATGACLAQLGTNTLNNLSRQMDAVWALILGLGGLFTFVETATDLALKPIGQKYPEEAKLSKITDAIETFTNKANTALANGTNIKLLIPNCTEFKKVVLEMSSTIEDVAAPLTFIIQLGCP